MSKLSKTSRIVHSGWMVKESLTWKKWERRWFVLDNGLGLLKYYLEPPANDKIQPRGELVVSKVWSEVDV